MMSSRQVHQGNHVSTTISDKSPPLVPRFSHQHQQATTKALIPKVPLVLTYNPCNVGTSRLASWLSVVGDEGKRARKKRGRTCLNPPSFYLSLSIFPRPQLPRAWNRLQSACLTISTSCPPIPRHAGFSPNPRWYHIGASETSVISL